MGVSFNLLDEPWIPCVLANQHVQEKSIKETLFQAHEIHAISDPSPLVTISLYRLLLAILHRVFGPGTVEEWEDLWGQGHFEQNRLENYFNKWHCRFELFHSEYPFYQTPGMPSQMLRPVALLIPSCASGNNAVLFDHTTQQNPLELTPKQAARWLLVQQNFALSGLVGSENGRDTAKAAPLSSGAVFLVLGDNLFQTLLLNMVVYNPAEGLPFPGNPDQDRPAWEPPPPSTPQKCQTRQTRQTRKPRGYLDYLTWQSRRLWLKPPEDPSNPVVREAIVSRGCEFPNGYNFHKEPMFAYKKNSQASQNPNPWQPLRFSPDRVLWRDSMALLQSTNLTQRPYTLDSLYNKYEQNVFDEAKLFNIGAFGLWSKQAKIFFWRQEHQPLPLRYLSEPTLVEKLQICLQKAETGEQVLRQTARTFATELLRPQSQAQGQPDQDTINSFVQSFRLLPAYWATLEPHFYRLMVDLAEAFPQGENAMDAHIQKWKENIRQTAKKLFEQTVRSFSANGRTLSAAVAAEGFLNSHLSQL